MKVIDYAKPADKTAFLKELNSPQILKDTRVEKIVAAVLKDIAGQGDKAVIKYTKQFDKADIKPVGMKVTEKEIKDAFKKADKSLFSSCQNCD